MSNLYERIEEAFNRTYTLSLIEEKKEKWLWVLEPIWIVRKFSAESFVVSSQARANTRITAKRRAERVADRMGILIGSVETFRQK